MSATSDIAEELEQNWHQQTFLSPFYQHVSGRWAIFTRSEELGVSLYRYDGKHLMWAMDTDIGTAVHYVSLVEPQKA